MPPSADPLPAAPMRLGVFLAGARGAISTSVAAGLVGLARGLLRPTGLVSSRPPFDALPLARPDSIVLGGWDVRDGSVERSIDELAADHVLPPDVAAAAKESLGDFERRIVPGIAPRAHGASAFEREAARIGAASPREQIAALVRQIEAFRAELGGAPVVVVNVASTEAWSETPTWWESLESFDAALDRGERPPPSCLYAYAAFRAGCGHVNFTPSVGAACPALREFALRSKVPHCGNDGKTGETLVKTTLGPMFAARALEVLAWQGYNMLGNRDGAVLADPDHKRAKVKSKDEALRQILGSPASLHSHVAIDYVPSLGDWKTAMDFVHFEGFLGCRMSLSFTWQGSDSALAAPLVIDLARFVELSARLGESGELAHLAAFFKSPLGGTTHDFHAQHAALVGWTQRVLAGGLR